MTITNDEIFLKQLQSEILTENFISDFITKKIVPNIENIKKAFASKNIETIKNSLKFLPSKSFSDIKSMTFSKDPDLKKEYINNLKKFKISEDDKLKAGSVFSFTITKKISSLISKEYAGNPSSFIDAMHTSLKTIEKIVSILADVALASGLITFLLSILQTMGLISVIIIKGLNTNELTLILYLSYLLLLLIARIISVIARIFKPKKKDTKTKGPDFEDYKGDF